MKLVPIKCPQCGSILKVNDKLDKITCNFCGAELVDDDISKLKVEGEVLLTTINCKKEIEVAKKMYTAEELRDAFKKLESVLKSDEFNHDAIKLYLLWGLQDLEQDSKYIDYQLFLLYYNRLKVIDDKEDSSLIKKIDSYIDKRNSLIKQNNETDKKMGCIFSFIFVLISFLIFVFIILFSNSAHEDKYSIYILDSPQKMSVGDKIQIHYSVGKNDVATEEAVTFHSTSSNATITDNGEITATSVGNFSFCVSLNRDRLVSKCTSINIIASCDDSYTFNAEYSEFYDRYYGFTKYAGTDFCPGTYIVHVDPVNSMAFNTIYTPRETYFMRYDYTFGLQGQDKEIVFLEGAWIKVDYGIKSITLTKK